MHIQRNYDLRNPSVSVEGFSVETVAKGGYCKYFLAGFLTGIPPVRIKFYGQYLNLTEEENDEESCILL
jgi:hypothetical protein